MLNSLPCREHLNLTIEEIIHTHQHQRLDSNIHRLNIRRNHVYADSLKAFWKGFPLSSTLRITFIGEPGIDAGGPLKEYLTLLMKEIMTNNSLFTGEPEYRGIVHSMKRGYSIMSANLKRWTRSRLLDTCYC